MTDRYICVHNRAPCPSCVEAERVPWLRAEVRRLQALADARLVEIEALRAGNRDLMLHYEAARDAYAELRLMSEAVHAHLDEGDGAGPGHDHRTKGIWDDTGEPCKWCATWSRFSDAIWQEVAQSAESESPQVSGTLACHPLGERAKP